MPIGTTVAVQSAMRTATVVTLFLVFLSPPARADWLPVVRGATSRVVASGRHAAVVRNQEVLVVREDGRVVSRLGNAETTDKLPLGPSLVDVAERTLDRLDVAEIDRGTDYTEDLVESESRLHERRFWRASPRVKPALVAHSRLALAASTDAIWIANGRGVFRVEDTGTIAPAFGREWTGSRIVAADGTVVVDKGNALTLLSVGGGEPRVVHLASPATHLSISASGNRLAWTTAATLHVVDVERSVTMDTPDQVVDLAFCGEAVLALLASSVVLAIPPEGRAEVHSSPPNARKLLCSAVPRMPWLIVGDGLWISSDQSHQWTPLPAPAGASVVDAAISDSQLWLATTTGLYMSAEASAVEAARENERSRKARRPSRASWLSWLMPNVSVRAAATFAPAGRRLEGFAFAAFPLGGKPIPIAAMSSQESAPVPEPVPAIDLRDADATCLAAARRRAVELAMTEPERARSYVTRAAHTAWLPELRLLVSRRYGRSESLDLNGSSSALSSPLGIDTVNDLRYEARATWDLGRLIFSTEELAAQAQALHMAELRRDIETTMNRLYFERRRLLIRTPREASIRLGEVEAELDALSGGAFGACTAERPAQAR